MGPRLLHGTLYATIYEVDRISSGFFGFCGDVQNSSAQSTTKKFFDNVKRCILCRPEITGAKLYATIDLEKARAGRTQVVDVSSSNNPIWNESFRIYCAHTISYVIFTVKYDDPVGATLIGRAYLPVDEVLNRYVVDAWLPILDEEKHPIHGHSRIHVRLQFSNVKEDEHCSRGISTPEFGGVPYTFFKERQNCRVTLYPDAHVPDDKMATYLRSQGFTEPERCWEDVFDAITNAKHLIYITGWSVYTKITLVRDPDSLAAKPGGDVTLGELLKKKASEGVNVLVLVWDDRTSIEAFKRDGLMATHDQETYDFFRDSNVHCFLSPRNADFGSSFLQDIQFSTRTSLFTHHQKTVVVDCEAPGEGERRSIVSFLGGIDLCDGRYDTREHSLFRTLNTVHSKDFHQPNFPGSSIQKGGPREPWHDIHCRLEGPVAWDVLYNFEQRWRRHIGDKFIFSLPELRNFTLPPSEIGYPTDPDRWNVQVFRSIDGNDAAGFPVDDPARAAELGLVTGKNHVIDRSIQDAYVNAIRRAKDFVYIENQYFLGSSYAWAPQREFKLEDINAIHLIPRELSLKIVSKIEAGERFAVYIVIPMWPEGVPESESVQAILDWQRRTMEMMYTDIASALRAKGVSVPDLREYLSFFCLGNREIKLAGEYDPPEKPDPGSDYARAQESRRFMIYVHSKLMIVDDEYIIIGSANINQRSMDGARDSEIAMGGYQPMHLAREGQPARGKIFGFRMALWCEHMNYVDDVFFHPESLECMKTVNAIADENWSLYTSDTLEKDLPGHLLPYPVHISANGEVQPHSGVGSYFPDTKAPILGTKSNYLPPILTT